MTRPQKADALGRYLRFIQPFTDEAERVGNTAGYDVLLDLEIRIMEELEKHMPADGWETET